MASALESSSLMERQTSTIVELGVLVGAVYQGLHVQRGAGVGGKTQLSGLGHRPGPDVNACLGGI